MGTIRCAVLATSALLLSACFGSPVARERESSAAGPTAALEADTSAGVLAEEICHPFSRAVEATNDVLEGRLAVPPFDPVEVDGQIDWAMDPYGHPSWRFGFHSLDFMWSSLVEPNRGRPEHLVQVTSILRDWIEHNPVDDPASDFSWNDHATAKRTHVMSCVHAISPSPWLEVAIAEHVDVLRQDDFYSAHTNHGIWQDTALLIAGCALGSDEVVAVAHERAAQAAAAKIDRQGVLDEQAPGYQPYVLRLYRWYDRIADTCERSAAAVVPDLPAMSEVIAHSRMPDGRLVPLGDTYLADPPAGDGDLVETPEGPVTQVYDAGYVFGRSAGGQDATFYALRFGPGRWVHGHDDHTSLFLYAHGAPRLVEGYHVGYERTPFRRYLQGPMSHNVVMLEDGDFDRGATTTLIDHDVSATVQAFTFLDQPYSDVERQRDVRISFNGPNVTVHDTIEADEEHTFMQLWHLPPDTSVSVDSTGAIATFADGVRMRIVQDLPVDSITVVEGHEDPLLGWAAAGHGVRTEAPVVVSRVAGDTVEFHTTISFQP